MSFKRFALLSTISYHNQRNHNNHSKSNSNSNNNNNYYKTTQSTTTMPELTTEIIISNKSLLTQSKQEKQQSQQLQTAQIIAPLFLGNTNTTTTTTSIISSTPLLTDPPYSDKVTTSTIKHKNDHKNEDTKSDDFLANILSDDASSYSNESDELLDLDEPTTPERQPSNTYTSTTYYGSGFGVFHQQNIRPNGGGIAYISGSSGNNGLGGGSYSNGINNNVNLLLGGAMLTLITTILCVVCYCCHRNIKKRTEAAYRQQRQWLENDPNMEIYSVEQCYETSGIFVADSMDGLATIPALHHEPPPSYDAVVAMQEQQQLLMQQHQQQIMVQQQLLQQQLSTNSSPPPGYRSSLDVRSIMQQARGNNFGGALTVDGSVISGMEINSLTASSANLRTAVSISPIDPLLNYNDVNGNASTPVPVSTATPTSNRTAACYLRNKQQQQRSIPAANPMSQLSMKKVLQAQSCCSLQRAEVENMWNAAAAALAARSAHLPSESRASTMASTSSPTLALSTRQQSAGCKTFNTNTPETFGTRYLKQNYYRKGCPLCGKFRYDIDSTLSISVESNLDALAAALTGEPSTSGQEINLQTANNENLTNSSEEEGYEGDEDNNNNDTGVSEDELDEVDDNENELKQHCSCPNSQLINEFDSTSCNSNQNINTQHNSQKTEEQQFRETHESNLFELRVATATPTPPDSNANTALATERQSKNQAASNNNNHVTKIDDSFNLPKTSAAAGTTLSDLSATAVSATSASSTPSVTIDLDCINENGIISLDMSKIIDKTGLPTYDAALKLESSGYV